MRENVNRAYACSHLPQGRFIPCVLHFSKNGSSKAFDKIPRFWDCNGLWRMILLQIFQDNYVSTMASGAPDPCAAQPHHNIDIRLRRVNRFSARKKNYMCQLSFEDDKNAHIFMFLIYIHIYINSVAHHLSNLWMLWFSVTVVIMFPRNSSCVVCV